MPETGSVRHLILGTAGHIDHGKTSLVKALTGTNTDRLPEEQRRGMTIELGFAELPLGDLHFGVVDVPGHERFVRTMVSGATGIDLAMVVVAADDSVMPQTIEHVEILHLLGVRHGVVALTKIDVVDADMVELVAEEVRELLAGTPLAGSPICPVSSITGAGLEELKQALARVGQTVAASRTTGPFRLSVDRVFTVAGRGTVVTGSALQGRVQVGDALELWPGGEQCRVRNLQSHGVQQGALTRGQRAAINISGVEREHVERGSELATLGFLRETRMLDVRVHCLASQHKPVKASSTVRLGMGTTETPVRLVLLPGEPLAPGGTAYAQIRSGVPLTAAYGQRFILRDENAVRTIGGGVVLRPVARRRRQSVQAEEEALRRLDTGDDCDRVEEVLRFAGFARPTDLHICAQAGVDPDVLPGVVEQLKTAKRWVPVADSGVFVVPGAIEDLRARLVARLERYHRQYPDTPGRNEDAVLGWLERLTDRAVAKPLLKRFLDDGTLRRIGSFLCLARFAPQLAPADERYLHAMVEEIRGGRFQPPALTALSFAAQVDRKRVEKLATLAVALGQLVKIDATIYLHADVERELRQRVAQLVAERGPVSVSEVREALDSSRKFMVPILEYLDRVGFTRRVGDQRVLAESERAEPQV
ncbi:MAG TPA: selenocysteine-specific translation elongation factor [Phycisphaerae bacterium]|nr:selenocysteine-specific translation elongation factor [Phycisphaerae bacterium]